MSKNSPYNQPLRITRHRRKRRYTKSNLYLNRHLAFIQSAMMIYGEIKE